MKQKYRYNFPIWLALSIVLGILPASAKAENIYFVHSEATSANNIAKIKDLSKSFSTLYSNEPIVQPVSATGYLADKDDLVVTFGRDAYLEYLNNPHDGLLIVSFIDSLDPAIASIPKKDFEYRFYNDIDPALQLALSKSILGDGAVLGILASRADVLLVKEYLFYAKTVFGLDLKPIITNKGDTKRDLQLKTSGYDGIILIKDYGLLNYFAYRDLVKVVVERNKTPLIGYNEDSVNKGSAFSFNASFGLWMSAVKRKFQFFSKNNNTQDQKHIFMTGDDFSVNHHLLRSFGYSTNDLQDASSIRLNIKRPQRAK